MAQLGRLSSLSGLRQLVRDLPNQSAVVLKRSRRSANKRITTAPQAVLTFGSSHPYRTMKRSSSTALLHRPPWQPSTSGVSTIACKIGTKSAAVLPGLSVSVYAYEV